MILAIDPGTTKSAWVLVDDDTLKLTSWAWEPNDRLRNRLHDLREVVDLVIEDVGHIGMAVGRDVFETVKWAGRFDADCTARWIARPAVKVHICGQVKAKPAEIKQAVIDRYGGTEKAVGGRKCLLCHGKGWRGRAHDPCPKWETKPGVLYDFSKAGMGAHGWDSLALALTAIGTEVEK